MFALLMLAVAPPAPDYATAYAESVKSGCPLVVFVGVDSPIELSGVVTCSVKSLPGFEPGTTIVATPDKGKTWQRAVYEYRPTESELKMEIDSVAGTPPVMGPMRFRFPIVTAALSPLRNLVGGCPGGVCPTSATVARRRGR